MTTVSGLRISLKHTLLIAALCCTTPALAADPKHLADHGDWAAYEHVTKSGKVCFAITEPKETLPKNVNRDPIYFLITNRPKEKIVNEVSVIIGYPFKANSVATTRVGDETFKMYTKGDGSWVDNAKNEKRLIKMMKNGNTMIVKGTSKRGTATTDEYSLIGITAVVGIIDKACK